VSLSRTGNSAGPPVRYSDCFALAWQGASVSEIQQRGSAPAGRGHPGRVRLQTTAVDRGDHRPYIFMPVLVLVPLSDIFVTSAGVSVLESKLVSPL
jgi:hypothetical protein